MWLVATVAAVQEELHGLALSHYDMFAVTVTNPILVSS